MKMNWIKNHPILFILSLIILFPFLHIILGILGMILLIILGFCSWNVGSSIYDSYMNEGTNKSSEDIDDMISSEFKK